MSRADGARARSRRASSATTAASGWCPSRRSPSARASSCARASASPLDGEVVAGASSVDEAPITGESVPVDKARGDRGVRRHAQRARRADGARRRTAAEDSTLARVAALVEEAQGSRAPSERFVDRFARVYTPLVFAAALAVVVVPVAARRRRCDTWLYRALALLIVACPCSLVISIPVAVVSAVGRAARDGVLIKGGQALEDLARDPDRRDRQDRHADRRPAAAQPRRRARRTVRGRGARARRGRRAALRAPARPGARARAARDRGLDVGRARRRSRRCPAAASIARVDGRDAVGRRPAPGRRTPRRDCPTTRGRWSCDGRDRHRARRGRPRARRLRARRPAATRGAPPRSRGLRAGRHRARGDAHRRQRAGRRPAWPRRSAPTSTAPGCCPRTSCAPSRSSTRERGPVAMVGDGINDAPALAAASGRHRDGRGRHRRRARNPPTSR